MGIGAKIKEYRTKAGLTQKDLADKLYVTYQAVSRWENDEAEPSFDTLKEICKILDCSTDELFEIEKKEEQKVDPEPVKVIERVIVQEDKVVLGICSRCGKPIYDMDDLKKHEESHMVHHGRSVHTEKNTVVLCSSCDKKRIKEEEEKAERQRRILAEQRRKRRVHSFVWPTILAIILITIGIVSFANGKGSIGFLWIGLGIFGYLFLATMILDNTFITEMWLEVASWGFVRMPGIIFSFSFDGLVFLIATKIILFLLGLGLALLSFGFATALASMLSIFVYPYALSKNIKGIE